MNLNTIRFENIWGKDDTVYELCDRMGILALVGWSCQWGNGKTIAACRK